MSQPSSDKSWRITVLLFLAAAALVPAVLVGWVNAKQNQHPRRGQAPLAPDWYRAGKPRAPWEGTPIPIKKSTDAQTPSLKQAPSPNQVSSPKADSESKNATGEQAQSPPTAP